MSTSESKEASAGAGGGGGGEDDPNIQYVVVDGNEATDGPSNNAASSDMSGLDRLD